MSAINQPVYNRGEPPQDFLDAIIAWAENPEAAAPLTAAPNSEPDDVLGMIEASPRAAEIMGDGSPARRLAVLLEVMRVHAGYESSWNWTEGVDTTNPQSVANPECEETGVFQVSYNSKDLDGSGSLADYLASHGLPDAGSFIGAMKGSAPLAIDYYARLVRISYRWAGPLIRPEDVLAHLSAAAIAEFEMLVS
jgi:hypothetical protein